MIAPLILQSAFDTLCWAAAPQMVSLKDPEPYFKSLEKLTTKIWKKHFSDPPVTHEDKRRFVVAILEESLAIAKGEKKVEDT